MAQAALTQMTMESNELSDHPETVVKEVPMSASQVRHIPSERGDPGYPLTIALMWHSFTQRGWNMNMRENQKALMKLLKITEIETKLPVMTEQQKRCHHHRVNKFGSNQWGHVLTCKDCRARVSYVPTPIASAHARVRELTVAHAGQRMGRVAPPKINAVTMNARAEAVRDMVQRLEDSNQIGMATVASSLGDLANAVTRLADNQERAQQDMATQQDVMLQRMINAVQTSLQAVQSLPGSSAASSSSTSTNVSQAIQSKEGNQTAAVKRNHDQSQNANYNRFQDQQMNPPAEWFIGDEQSTQMDS